MYEANYFFFLLICSFVACNQNKQQTKEEVKKSETLLDRAIANLPKIIEEDYPHDWNSKPTISDRKTIVNSDSTFVMQFKMKYLNEFGGWSNGKFCYVYTESGNCGAMYALKDYSQNSNYEFIFLEADIYNRRTEKGGSVDFDSPEFINDVAQLYCIVWGHKVGK